MTRFSKIHKVEFTQDMIENMMKFFEPMSDRDGVLTVEVLDSCYFIADKNTGKKLSIGLARHPDHKKNVSVRPEARSGANGCTNHSNH